MSSVAHSSEVEVSSFELRICLYELLEEDIEVPGHSILRSRVVDLRKYT